MACKAGQNKQQILSSVKQTIEKTTHVLYLQNGVVLGEKVAELLFMIFTIKWFWFI